MVFGKLTFTIRSDFVKFTLRQVLLMIGWHYHLDTNEGSKQLLYLACITVSYVKISALILIHVQIQFVSYKSFFLPLKKC